MQIIIETNGRGDETSIKINGVEQTDLTFFEFSANTEKSNKCKMYLMRIIDKKLQPLNYYADDFRKFDEATEINLKGGVNVIGSRKSE